MVKAVVVRGTYTERLKDGTKRIVRPDDKDPSVEVTEAQLKTFSGVLVPAGEAARERVAVKAENQRVTVAEVEAAEEEEGESSKSSRRR